MSLELLILIGGIVLLVSVFLSKSMYKYGIPTLIIFLVMGMIAGNDKFGVLNLEAGMASNIASFALLIIIFSGGFDTSWKRAKTNASASIVLASLGVFLTAGFVGVFTYLIIPSFTWLHAMLVGAIISSTDAAAVFSILRSKKLNFKNDIGPLLEMESGSNDPSAYMVTIIILGMIDPAYNTTFLGVIFTFIMQVVLGLGVGALVGLLGVKIINKIKLEIDGLYIILALGLMLASFGLSDWLLGNGYLAVYVTGIIIGNKNIVYKASLMQFFDALSWLAQILLFFSLGLFVSPSLLIQPYVLWPGIGIALFISFVARPLAVIPIMKGLKKPFKDSILVSWVGFRGAASIVFAILALTRLTNFGQAHIGDQVFAIVFIVAIISVLLQGLLLVPVANKLDLIEPEETELKIFTDYSGAIYTDILEVHIQPQNIMVGKKLKDIQIPEEILIILIQRNDQMIPPRGDTIILGDDVLMLVGKTRQDLFAADKLIRERNEQKRQ